MASSREFRTRLARRTKRSGVSIPAALFEKLEAYYRLLQLWNRKINLTALPLEDFPDATLDRLLVEPLVAVREIRPQSALMDLGSGGGSPAVPIKLAVPGLRLLMVEAKTRKSAFLREVVRQLALSNASVETARFEELLAKPDLHEAMDVVTIRAVRVEPKLLTTAQAFLKPMGQVLLFSSTTVDEQPVHPPLEWVSTQPLVESLGSRLVILRKSALPLSR